MSLSVSILNYIELFLKINETTILELETSKAYYQLSASIHASAQFKHMAYSMSAKPNVPRSREFSGELPGILSWYIVPAHVVPTGLMWFMKPGCLVLIYSSALASFHWDSAS